VPTEWLNRRTITARMILGVIGAAYLGMNASGVSDEHNPFTGLCHGRRLRFFKELTYAASGIELGDSDRIWFIARGLLQLPEATQHQRASCALLFLRTALQDEGFRPTDEAFAEMAELLLVGEPRER
jgi:hypothetical protein